MPIFLLMSSCGSLKEASMQDRPGFFVTAEKYLISSPIPSITPKPQIYRIEEVATNTVYEIRLSVYKPGASDYYKHPTRSGSIGVAREFEEHRFFIDSTMAKKNYEIIGTTSLVRATEKQSSNVTGETTATTYPVEFWIFEDGKDVGTVVVHSPRLAATQKIDFVLHDRRINLEWQSKFNTKYYSLLIAGEQLALIEMKPKGFIASSMKGEADLKPNLSIDQKSDLFTCLIIAEIVLKIIEEVQ
jgi:hypothetical protein